MTEHVQPEGFTPNQPENVPQEHICSICGGRYWGHGNNAQPITQGRCCDRCDALVVFRRINDATGNNLSADVLEGLQVVLESFPLTPEERLSERLEQGSEPFWMQDVRLAQRRIEAQRAQAARSTDSDEGAG